MKALIVYYSMGGFTKSIAEKLARKTGADLLALYPVKAYPDSGAKKFLVGGKAATFGDKPKLQPYIFNAEKYDKIIIGSPVWASTFAPPIRSFIVENSEALSGKRLCVFFTQLGNGADKASAKLCRLVGIEKPEREAVFFEPNKKDEHKENAAKLSEFAKAVSE